MTGGRAAPDSRPGSSGILRSAAFRSTGFDQPHELSLSGCLWVVEDDPTRLVINVIDVELQLERCVWISLYRSKVQSFWVAAGTSAGASSRARRPESHDHRVLHPAKVV